MIKKSLAFLLVILMSINSIAAVVSDNDGSAFITKAEFDSLKSSFQSQIDQYNTSIDSKIDGAIAAYLAGIKVTTDYEQTSLLWKCSQKSPVKWLYNWTFPLTRLGDRYGYGSYTSFTYGGQSLANADHTAAGIVSGQIYKGTFWFTVYSAAGGNTVTKSYTGTNPSIFVIEHKYDNQDGIYYADDKDFTSSVPYATIYAVTNSSYDRIHMGQGDTPSITWSVSECKKTASDMAAGSKTISNTTTLSGGTMGNKSSFDRSLPIQYTVGFDDVSGFATTNVNNIKLLSCKKIDSDVYAVSNENLANVHYEDVKASKDKSDWAGYINFTRSGANALNDHYWSNGGDDVGNYVSGDGVKYNIYEKRYDKLNAKNYVLNEYSSATSEKVYYYSGIPLVKVSMNGILCFKLRFNWTATSGTGNFVIRKSAFSNSDTLDTTDVIDLYSDKELKTKITDLSFKRGVIEDKTFYIRAKQGEVYWFKPYISNGNFELISREETFKLSTE